MTWLAWNAMREIAAEAAEPLPDPWAMAAEAIRAELADRRRAEYGVLIRLSWHALAVLQAIERLGGQAFAASLRRALDQVKPGAERAVDVWRGMEELYEAGLLAITWAKDEDGEEAEPILSLDYEREVGEDTE